MHRNEKWLLPTAVWFLIILQGIAAHSQQLTIQNEDGKQTICLVLTWKHCHTSSCWRQPTMSPARLKECYFGRCWRKLEWVLEKR